MKFQKVSDKTLSYFWYFCMFPSLTPFERKMFGENEGKNKQTNAKFAKSCFEKFQERFTIFELFFQNSSYVSGVSVCIFVAL